MAATIIAAVGLAYAIGSTIYGAAQQKKANKLRAANVRPTYTIAPELYQNQQLAESRAGTGLPDYVQQYYRQGNERGLSSSVDRILKGGGSSAELAPAYSLYTDANARLAVADDDRNYKNMQSLLDQNRYMAEARDTDWQVNQYGPYADKAQLAAEMYQSGGRYIQSGIETAGSSISGYASARGQQKDTKKVLDTAGSGQGTAGKSGTGIDYNPSLMSSTTGQSYLGQGDDLSRRMSTMTPEQQRQINGWYGNRLNLNLDTSGPRDLTSFNANSYRSY